MLGFFQQTSVGLLILRLYLGGVMVFYGIKGLAGGPEAWEGVGSAMSLIGIDFAPIIFGFLAKATEAVGGLLVLAGICFRPALTGLFCVMVVAAWFLISGDRDPRFPMALAVMCLGLFFSGPGKIAARLF